MNLEEYRKAYYEYSGKASDISRQLGFAGIALIWLFKTGSGDDGYFKLDSDLFWAGILIVTSLALDLLHYIVSTAIWGIYSRVLEERGVKPTTSMRAPSRANWPGNFFFWAKIFVMLTAYGMLLRFLWRHVS